MQVAHSDTAAPAQIGRDRSLAMLERMLLIRRIEERLGDEFKAGNLPGGVHLYIGEEAIAVGVCAHLADTDWIASTHRGHGHFLAKGGDPNAMVAEIYGRKTGICRGMGGSMHVADVSKGILGANGIVGAGISLTTGAALAAQLDGKGAVAVCFFGDGAAAQGVLMEALNLSALWKLPLLLVCENNGYSEYTPSSAVTAGVIAERAKPFGVPGVIIDGNDIVEVWQAADAALERARRGEGPTLIEARTYRMRGHIEAEAAFLQGGSYRSQEEVEQWKPRDPIDRFSRRLQADGLIDARALQQLEDRVRSVVKAAFEFAEQSDMPDASQVFDFMFAGQRP
jgi:acetoin:2,6-dichlorophenolindophenol oxidoreductase subunit alpha